MEKLNFRNRRRKNAYIIDERLSQRAVSLANYMIDSSLAGQVREVLDLNKSERHIRGGMATKEKYAHMHM